MILWLFLRVSFVPKSRSEVVRAREECRRRRRVHYVTDDAVVAEREELLARGVSRVPAAERRRRLVREHDVVLAVVEHCLGLVAL